MVVVQKTHAATCLWARSWDGSSENSSHCGQWYRLLRTMTVYAFSAENWTRQTRKLSLSWICRLNSTINMFLKLPKNIWRFKWLETDRLPKQMKLWKRARKSWPSWIPTFSTLPLITVDELKLQAVKLIAQDVLDAKVNPGDNTEELVGISLGHLPKTLLIRFDHRTSSWLRLSNFLPWQAAYSVFISDVLWLTLMKPWRELLQDLTACRRFGGVWENYEKGLIIKGTYFLLWP